MLSVCHTLLTHTVIEGANGVTNCQLTTNFSAKCQLTTNSSANCQSTTKYCS